MSSSGGHGEGVPAWIVTYCDMVTLLICFFVVLATYGARDATQLIYARKNSIAGGMGGTGFVGPPRRGLDKNQVAVRLFPLRPLPRQGSEMPPLYSEFATDLKKTVQAELERDAPGGLGDSYELDLPLGLLFEGGRLSAAGRQQLQRIAGGLASLPYEIQVQTASREQVPRAAAVYRFLFDTGLISHTRLGVALRPEEPALREAIRLAVIRSP